VKGTFEFGDFELDPARLELRCRGKVVGVQPKVLRVLLLLVEHRDRVVSRRELLETVWSGETVSAASIKRAIQGARRALGDSGDSQSTIRTVPRLGYRFAATIAPSRSGATAPKLEAVRSAPRAPEEDPFVGRESILAMLETAMRTAISGKGGLVLLTGEPGLGKTRMAQQLAASAAKLGADSWLGRCLEVDGAPPFWPWIQILRDCMRDLGPGEMRRLLGAEGADIAQAVPELRQMLPELPSPPPIDPVSGRFRLFDSVATFLKRASGLRPILLTFDDLHQADRASVQLLEFVSRQATTARLLLAATFRPRVGGADVLPEALQALARENTIQCIELRGLSRDELGHYLELVTGKAASDAELDSLLEKTAGNPLFVRQLVHGFRGEQLNSRTRFGDWLSRAPRSTGLQGAIQRHLEVLSQPAQALLRVAAVLGREFSVGLLVEIAAVPLESVSEMLAGAVAAGLIHGVTDVLRRYRFTHVLVRDALYDQLSPSERARLHGRAARALDSRGAASDDVLLAELTRHYVAAAPTHDDGHAYEYAVRAARTAAQRLAYDEAATYFDRALSLTDFQAPEPRRRMGLLLEKGEALAHTNEAPVARSTLVAAFGLACQLDAVDELVRAAGLVARHLETGNVDLEQVEILRQAIAHLSDDDPRIPSLRALQAKSLLFSREQTERAQLALTALREARKLSDLTLRADAFKLCHEALIDPGYLGERLAIVEEMTAIAHQLGDPMLMLRAATAHVENCVEVGDMVGVDAAVATIEVLAEQYREPLYRWQARAVRGMRAYVSGRLELAEQLIAEALALSTSVGEPAYNCYCAQIIGVWLVQGRYLEAASLVREAAMRYPAILGWRAVLACADVFTGREAHARKTLERMMENELSDLPSKPHVMLNTLTPLVELCAIVGDAEIAGALYDALLPFAHHHGHLHLGVMSYGPIERHLGMMSTQMGEFGAAEQHFERALVASRKMQSPVFESMTLGQYARMLMTSGQSSCETRASELLEHGLALANASGMHGVTLRCHMLAQQYALRIA
jgi:DNA-binding winged helix-turn-helix (wHTH) protein/tetratricopeptide (TPR) repeat protein